MALLQTLLKPKTETEPRIGIPERLALEPLSRFRDQPGLDGNWRLIVESIEKGWSRERDMLVQAALQIRPDFSEHLVAQATDAFLLQNCDLFGWCDACASAKLDNVDILAVKKVEGAIGQKLVRNCAECSELFSLKRKPCLWKPHWTLLYGGATAVGQAVKSFVHEADPYKEKKLPEWAESFVVRVFGRPYGVFNTSAFPVPLAAEEALANSFIRAIERRQTRQLRKIAAACESLGEEGGKEKFLCFIARVMRSAQEGTLLPVPGKSLDKTKLERTWAALAVACDVICTAHDRGLLPASDLKRIQDESAKVLGACLSQSFEN